ncbi:KTSC domain-containing protein [Sphingomonas sp.]|uniref:KTSC domain-containing protein n=1 Tax=Sphingomonas sp. TaxID=28214 RepID=UPI0017BC517F|nr:KTSC domain-containing protein [Sphingomonas sp.]MBA3512339.1 KTSC domain-containing protein [Sphingomonas sp.]
MPSTVIRRFDYSPERRELMVEFVTGRRYVYLDVPEEEARAMRGAFAKGRYFNAHIRDHYRFRELTGEDEVSATRR